MNKMRLFLFTLMIFTFLGTIQAQSKTKETLAVLPLNGGSVELQGYMITELFKSNRFRIIERSRLDDVIKEQRFQVSNLSSREIERLGQILGVRLIITGELSYKWSGSTEYLNANVRLIDVQTGFIEVAVTSSTSRSTSPGVEEGSLALKRIASDCIKQILENY